MIEVMSDRKLKALVVVRLSRLMEASTSAERQEEVCRDLCQRQGWEVVGVASDLNVSAGAMSPFERPELSKWLGDGKDNPGRVHEFDVIVFWRLDRLVRSMSQLYALMQWCDEHDVSLRSATEEYINTSTDMGRIMLSLVGSFAQVELEAIRERTGADQHHRIITGRYRGSLPSWGYKPGKDAEGHSVVVPDPVQVDQINQAVQLILSGKSVTSVARTFNQQGYKTPRDLNDERRGRVPKGRKWNSNRLKSMLTSKAMLGYAIVREPVLDSSSKPKRDSRGRKIYSSEATVAIGPDGMPVRRAEPILSHDVYGRVCKALNERSVTVSSRSQSLLIGVLFCGVCGRVAYKIKPNNGRRAAYRCSSAQAHSEARCCDKTLQVDQEFIEDTTVSLFLGIFGDSQRAVRKWDAGLDNSEEVAELTESIDGLTVAMINQRPGSTSYKAFLKQIETMQDRLDALEAEGVREPGWVWEPTGETIRQWWDKATVTERNAYLIECSIRVEFEHSEHRKRGETPFVRFNVENMPQAIEGMITGDTVETIKDVLSNVPNGYTLNIGPDAGAVTLTER